MEYRETDEEVEHLLQGLSDNEEEEQENDQDLYLADLNLSTSKVGGEDSAVIDELLMSTGVEKLVSSDEEDDIEARQKECQEDLNRIKEEAKRQDFYNSERPPGLDLFERNESKMNGFKYFNMDTLDLERDFGYSRRPKLRGHGFTDELLDRIFKNRYDFVRYLMPEAESVLLCDRKDYCAIMEYLLYSISVCTDGTLCQLMQRALFSLRKYYSFRWHLKLGHVHAILLNYGGNQKAIYNKKFYKENLKDHLTRANSFNKKISAEYRMSKIMFSREKLQSNDFSDFTPIEDDVFNQVLSNTLLVLAEFISSFPSNIRFRNQEDFSDECVLIFLMTLVGTDCRVIHNVEVFDSISLMIHHLLDNVPANLWYLGPSASKAVDQDNLPAYQIGNYSREVAKLIFKFFPEEMCEEIIIARSSGFDDTVPKGDHVLNMVHKLDLLPRSLRGNILRKQLIFLYIHTLQAISTIKIPACASIAEVVANEQMIKPNKMINYLCRIEQPSGDNHLKLRVFVQLLNELVGHEPLEDLTPENREHIHNVKVNVLDKIKKKIPSVNTINARLDGISTTKLHNYLDIILYHWESVTSGHR